MGGGAKWSERKGGGELEGGEREGGGWEEERGAEKPNYALNACMSMYRQVSYHGKMKDELLRDRTIYTHTSHGWNASHFWIAK